MIFKSKFRNLKIGQGENPIRFENGVCKTNEADKIELLKSMGFVPVEEPKKEEPKKEEPKEEEPKEEEPKEEKKEYKCEKCDFATSSISALKGHMTKNHK